MSLKLLALIAAITIVYIALRIAPNPDACPSGSSYQSSSLVEYCESPTGRTSCVIAAFGFTPVQANSSSVDRYVRSVPLEGPWCANARDFGASP